MFLALILVAAVTLLLCWLLFALASLALPLFVAVIAGQAAYHSGAGLLGASIVGLIAGGATLFAGQILLASARSTSLRSGILVMFVTPATIAGFSAAHGLAALCVPSSAWQLALGLIGAGCVGMSALSRLAAAPLDVDRSPRVSSPTM